MGFTFVIWMKALQYAENTAKVSNLIFLSPFIALFFIHFLVGETIAISTIFGLALIIAGIMLQQKKTKKVTIQK
jgi:drug/metabolite transporter (DMT)-like permease